MQNSVFGNMMHDQFIPVYTHIGKLEVYIVCKVINITQYMVIYIILYTDCMSICKLVSSSFVT